MDTRLRFDLHPLVSVFSNDPYRTLLAQQTEITIPTLLQSIFETFDIDFRSYSVYRFDELLQQLGVDEAEADLTSGLCHSMAARLLPWSSGQPEDGTQLVGRFDAHPDGRWLYLEVYVRDPDPVKSLLRSIDIEQDHYPENMRRMLGLV